MFCSPARPLDAGCVRSTVHNGVLSEDGARSLRVAGNGATTLKLLHELKLCDQILPAASASKVRYVWYKGKRRAIPTLSAPLSLVERAESFPGLTANRLLFPLLKALALEPFQNRHFLDNELDGGFEGNGGHDNAIKNIALPKMLCKVSIHAPLKDMHLTTRTPPPRLCSIANIDSYLCYQTRLNLF